VFLLSSNAFSARRQEARPIPDTSGTGAKRYRFVVAGYVVMPEHIHLLLSEPEMGTPPTVMQVLKQRSARTGRKGRS